MAATNDPPHEQHTSLIKTPKQLTMALVLGFLLPVILLIMLSQLVFTATKTNVDQPAFTDEAIRARLQPVARVSLDVTGGAGAGPKAARSGEEVYKAVCAACHAAGAAGAPKFGDNAAWAPRLKEGYEHLVESVVKGKGAMPARGGGSDLSDDEIARAVAFIANNAGGSFKEPAAPADAKPAASSAASAPAGAAPATEPAVAAAAAPAPVADAAHAGGSDAAKGKALYDQACMACHATGAAGAPKMGDKPAWASRIGTGMDTLYASAIKGKGAMPAKGGRADASDADVKAAVDYMVAASK
jgi:cytochrome c5